MSNVYAGGQGEEALKGGRRGISGSTVKLVGIVTMFIDHLAAAVLFRVIFRILMTDGRTDRFYDLYSIYSAMRTVGRLGFPIFCFLLVEGFDKTRSRAKYALRLGIFALISEIPFDLAFNAKVLEFENQNVYFTLFFGMLVLCAYDFLQKHMLPTVVRWLMCVAGVVVSGAWLTQFLWQYIQRYVLQYISISIEEKIAEAVVFCGICLLIAVLLLLYGRRMGTDMTLTVGTNLVVLFLLMWLADLLHTDYSGMGVLTITVIYLFRRYKVLAMAGGCIVLTMMNLNEVSAFLTLIPVAMYNGKRGLKLKYFFYAFYPVHLLLLWLVTWFMGTSSIPVF